MSLRRGRGAGHLLLVVFCSMFALALFSVAAAAQEEDTPKVDIFLGYQWLHPGGTVPSPFQPPNAPIGQQLKDMAIGGGASGTYNFTPHWGLEADFGANSGDNGSEQTASIGPRFAWRNEGVMLFAHTMFGYNRLNVDNVKTSNGIGAVLGGGMDLALWRRLSIRLFEADYVWAHHNFSDVVSPNFADLARPDLQGIRLRTGIVLNFGYPNPAIPAASCSIQPSEVMVGEPVTVTANATNFNPKHTLTYNWTGTGGKVTGKDTTARSIPTEWRAEAIPSPLTWLIQNEEGR